MVQTSLRAKAGMVEEFLVRHFLDSHNVVFTFLDKDTLRPPREDFFPAYQPGMSWRDGCVDGYYTRSEHAAYENCGMCTGAYLQSLCFQYRVEPAPHVRGKMARGYQALRHIYEMGRGLEEGFFPKIYNRSSRETSSDQVIYAVLALDHFYEFAAREQKNEIDAMIPQMAHFWLKRNYIYPYLGEPEKHWPLTRFPPLLCQAYKHSGDALFKKEYERLLGLGISAEPEFAQLKRKKNGLTPLSKYETRQRALLVAAMADGITMDVMNFDCLIRCDPGNPLRGKWEQGIATMWEEAKITLAPNGKYYAHLLVDPATGETRRPAGYGQDDGPSGCESGWSTMVARGAVMAAQHIPARADIPPAVVNVLEKIDVDGMTYYDNPERFAPHQRFLTRFLSGDSIANWLWAYWQGRYQHIFEE